MHVEQGGSGPVVLLLHGFTGSARSWDAIRAELMTRFTVIAVDLPGHGRSGIPTGAFGMGDVARELAALLTAATTSPAAVLGYSMGGRIALRLALDHPSVVGSLILESTSPGIGDPSEREARRRSDAELASLMVRQGLAAFVDQWEQLPLWARHSRMPAGERARLREIRLSHDPGMLSVMLTSTGAGEDPPVLERLPEIQVPALLIAGMLDAAYVAHARAMAARLPNARVEIVPNAGHMVHFEAPARFHAVVKTFLEAHSFTGSPQENA